MGRGNNELDEGGDGDADDALLLPAAEVERRVLSTRPLALALLLGEDAAGEEDGVNRLLVGYDVAVDAASFEEVRGVSTEDEDESEEVLMPPVRACHATRRALNARQSSCTQSNASTALRQGLGWGPSTAGSHSLIS